MGRKVLGRALLACVLVFALQGVAVAQPDRGALRKCFGEEISPEELEIDCVKFGDGDWHPVGGTRGESGFLGTFLFFALLLSLVPAFVGVAVSKDAGVAPLVGFAIGLFGSWIGVIILYVSGQSRKASSSVITIGSSSPRETAPDAGPGQPAERLRTLKDLLDEGLITQEEYEARRAAAIERL
jgi:hypothetical protein